MHKSVGDIIDALGGTKAVADALGLSLSTVSSWRTKDRNSIPADRWLEIAALARDLGTNGITLETLAVLHARPSATNLETSA